jgi:phosphatidate cytidylyltransferase
MQILDVPQNAFSAMVAVVGLLGVASFVLLVLGVSNPDRDYTEVRLRTQSWWVICGLIFLVLVLSQTAAIVFIGFLSFLALKEFLSIVPTRQADRRVVFLAYLTIPIQYYWVSIEWYGMFAIFIPVYVFVLLPVRMVLVGETHGFIRAAGIIHWAVMLTVYSISHVAFLLVTPEQNPLAGGIGLVLFLLFMTEFNDICQYLWGKLLGRRKIIPKVSPNKTWAGFVGGVATVSVCGAFAGPWLTPLTSLQGLGAGALIGVAGFMGDVVVSSVKRDLSIKRHTRSHGQPGFYGAAVFSLSALFPVMPECTAY